MHVAIDCRCVHPRMGGIGRAALELVRALGSRPRGHRATMIVGAGHAGEVSVPGIHILPVDAAMIDPHFEQFRLPSLLSEIGADLYLNTTFAVPAIKTTRWQASIIHDVVFEDHPEYVEPGLGSYLRRSSRFAAAHADHVLTVSDHARDRIREVYGIDSSRITRVYNGIAPSCFVPPSEEEVARVRAKYRLVLPFVLYLGTLEMKKGVVELVRAFRRAMASGLSATLVLAGANGGPALDIDALVRDEGCAEKVRVLGFVDEADKKPLLKAADLFVYPSLYEGFGIPPLEAMALGTPCIVSDQTALPEITGGAAEVVRACDPAAFAAAIIDGLENPGLRRAASTRGPARAREFSWDRSAAEVLDLIERMGAN